MTNGWYIEGLAEGEVTSDNAPLTPSKLLYNRNLLRAYSSWQTVMPPHTLPQICAVHSQVESHQRWVRQACPYRVSSLPQSLRHRTAQRTSQDFHSHKDSRLKSFFYPHHFWMAVKCDVGVPFSLGSRVLNFSFLALEADLWQLGCPWIAVPWFICLEMEWGAILKGGAGQWDRPGFLPSLAVYCGATLTKCVPSLWTSVF